jgi:hypothetical protein
LLLIVSWPSNSWISRPLLGAGKHPITRQNEVKQAAHHNTENGSQKDVRSEKPCKQSETYRHAPTRNGT